MPSGVSIADAQEGLAADRGLTMSMIDQASDRMDDPVPAPRHPRPTPLGQQPLGMVDHLKDHEAQCYR